MADDQGKANKAKLLGWLDMGGVDFLGTGMSFGDFMLFKQVERWKNSLSCIRDRKEQRRRVRMIRAIAVAMEALEKQHGVPHHGSSGRGVQRQIFNTACMDGAILAIINGEWDEARSIAESLDYSDEAEQVRAIYAPMHAPIKALILRACDEVIAEPDPGVPSTVFADELPPKNERH
jgi:hypothetical protein